MDVLAAAWSHQPEARLDAMKQLVHEQPPVLPPINLGIACQMYVDHVDPAPLDRCVHEAERAGTVTSRRRGRGDRASGGVRDHHRPAQRDAPETAAVPLAERLDLLEYCSASA